MSSRATVKPSASSKSSSKSSARSSARSSNSRKSQRKRGPHIQFESSGRLQSAGTAGNEPVIIGAKGVKKSYRKGTLEVPVLKGVDVSVRRGEFSAIIGQSGSGKSTLLHLLGTLDTPDEGEIQFESKRIDNCSARQRDRLRNDSFGFIFQFYHLLPELSMLENVLVPKMVAEGAFRYWRNRRKYVARAKEILDVVGLSHRIKHRPCELSGGEMQRTAIARALISEPRLLLADEPTGNLDGETGREIMKILRDLNRDENLTIVMVTHDESIAKQAHNVIRLAEGRVQKESSMSS